MRLGFVEHLQVVLSLPHRPCELLLDLFEFLQELFDVFRGLSVAFDLFEFVATFDLHRFAQFVDPLLDGFELLFVLAEFLRPAFFEFLAQPDGFELIRIEVQLRAIRESLQPVLAAREQFVLDVLQHLAVRIVGQIWLIARQQSGVGSLGAPLQAGDACLLDDVRSLEQRQSFDLRVQIGELDEIRPRMFAVGNLHIRGFDRRSKEGRFQSSDLDLRASDSLAGVDHAATEYWVEAVMEKCPHESDQDRSRQQVGPTHVFILERCAISNLKLSAHLACEFAAPEQ